MLLTRSREGNAELAAKLRSAGLEPISVNVIGFSPPESWSEVDAKLRDLASYDWVLLTSATGVKFFLDRARSLSLDLGRLPKIGAVGEKTAESMARGGLRADFVPSRFLTRALADELPGMGGRVLLLRSDVSDPEMAEVLRGRGFGVDEVAIYRTRHLPVEGGVWDADLVVFGSPSAVEGLCAQLPDDALSKLRKRPAACIGPVTARAAEERGFAVVAVPKTHSFDSLLGEIRRMNEVV